ncbi:MAG: hypothetical protein IT377_26600 [Polyangiaceae bacterium]|nr:hypothetical protein [Polyangiaceae bacterium]
MERWVLLLMAAAAAACSSSTTNEGGGGGSSTGGAGGASGGSGGGSSCSPANCWAEVEKSPTCGSKFQSCKTTGDCLNKAENIVAQLCSGIVPADIPVIAAPLVACIAADKVLSPLCYGVPCLTKPGDKCSAVGLGEHCCAPMACGGDAKCQ